MLLLTGMVSVLTRLEILVSLLTTGVSIFTPESEYRNIITRDMGLVRVRVIASIARNYSE